MNDAEVLLTDGATFRNQLRGWNLLVILDEFMALILHIGNSSDYSMVLWYGTTIIETFCFGVIVPLIIPTVILVPAEFTKALGFLVLFALCISVMTI